MSVIHVKLKLFEKRGKNVTILFYIFALGESGAHMCKRIPRLSDCRVQAVRKDDNKSFHSFAPQYATYFFTSLRDVSLFSAGGKGGGGGGEGYQFLKQGSQKILTLPLNTNKKL